MIVKPSFKAQSSLALKRNISNSGMADQVKFALGIAPRREKPGKQQTSRGVADRKLSAVSGASGISDSPMKKKIGQKRRFQELRQMMEEDSNEEDLPDSRPQYNKRPKRGIEESPGDIKKEPTTVKMDSGDEEVYVAGRTNLVLEPVAEPEINKARKVAGASSSSDE